MGKYLWLSVAVLLAVASPAWSLRKCFRCDDCKNEVLTQSTCERGFDYCMTFQLGDKVTKLCAPENFCKRGSGDQGSLPQKFIAKLKEIYADLDLNDLMGKNKDDDSDDKIDAHCCDADYCNGSLARKASFSLLLSLLPLPVLYYILGY